MGGRGAALAEENRTDALSPVVAFSTTCGITSICSQTCDAGHRGFGLEHLEWKCQNDVMAAEKLLIVKVCDIKIKIMLL